ncbi:ABC transporter ATP-binding protein [Halonotius terrestris]|uniref:ABC transporter ATP-binding protein n=1 Tax=Halonotius terrestris TaxID=2487750 RepID=A0A8J8TDP8_9EURY|nr:ABC transporter ATP-binding protein [Halonotius terrestris]TQQ83517.1 ABC transporter ATP-binding protein [Halonotius terrestris]
MHEALVATDVTKRYGETVALDGVDLSVADGEVFGLIGPNGAGKTTLVRALTGTTAVDGEVRVQDRHPTDVDADRVGLLPQSFSPPTRLTARELIDYYGGLYETARDTDEILSTVGLAETADSWYETLSGGQQRRVCVGIALVNDPDVLFLDEPTTGIDPAGRRSLWSVLETLADGGTTILLTSHSMAEVQRLSDRVGLLRDGQLVAVGTPDELIADHGGGSRLVIDTDASEAAADALADAGFAATAEPTAVVVDNVSPVDIGDAVDALSAADLPYESLTWSEPTLEDVYLQLTGESFEGAGSRSATATPAVDSTAETDTAATQEGRQ